MEPALPLKSVVMFIAFGAMVAFMVFLFIKRQITRFALKSNRHVPISTGVPKSLRQEIERRLKRTTEIKYEPILLSQATEQTISDNFQGETCHFLYRMKTVDALKQLDAAMIKANPSIKRQPGDNLNYFLQEQRKKDGLFHTVNNEVIEKFVNSYDHARHDPDDFGAEQYEDYMKQLKILIDCTSNVRRRNISQDTTDANTALTQSDNYSSSYITHKPGKSTVVTHVLKLSPMDSNAKTLENGAEESVV